MFRRSARPIVGQPVDDPVVDHLRLRAHPRVDLLSGDAEHLRGGRRVHVLAALEDLHEHRLLGRHAQARAARSGSSRLRSARSRPRPRSSRGSRGPRECGSGRSACSGWWMRRRPVWAPACRKVVWMRERSSTICGQHIQIGLDQGRKLAPALDTWARSRAPRGSPATRARRSRSRSCRDACAKGRA